MHHRIREPAVAGLFYPAEPEILAVDIETLLEEAGRDPLSGDPVALVVPHAGYMYSGFTASRGYNVLSGKQFDTIVIVSPSHREYFEGVSIFDGEGFKTPLGVLHVDHRLAKALEDGELIVRSDAGHGKEHAVEVHVPFLQKVCGDVKILPIVMGDQRRNLCFTLGDRLADVLEGTNAFLIASTDLSHYHRYDEAERLDAIVAADIARFDVDGMMADLESKRVEMCGGGPAVAVLRAAKRLGATHTKVLHHCNSGDVTGKRESVVGYLSAVAFRAN